MLTPKFTTVIRSFYLTLFTIQANYMVLWKITSLDYKQTGIIIEDLEKGMKEYDRIFSKDNYLVAISSLVRIPITFVVLME